MALSSVAFAEQVNIEEVLDSTGGSQRPSQDEHTDRNNIEADLADFFAEE